MDLSWLTASPWPIVALSFAGVGALIFGAWLAERRLQARAERIRSEGDPAEATVLSARDTGWRTNGRLHIGYRLEVRRPGHPPYSAETTLMIPRWTPIPYPPGSVIAVRVDRDHPEHVVFAGGVPALGGLTGGEAGGGLGFGSASVRSVSVGRGGGATIVVDGKAYDSVEQLPPEARAAYEQAMGALADKDGDGLPDIFGAAGAAGLFGAAAAGGGAPAERLRQLKAMLDDGLITPAEYEAKRAKILEAL